MQCLRKAAPSVGLLLLTAGLPAAWDNVPALQKPLALYEGVIELDHLQAWSERVDVPAFGPDEAPVLALRARLATAGDGGCNYVLRITVNDHTLTGDPFRPRLLNKPLAFDPPNTEYHFQWHRDGLWMMIFTRTFDTNWGGSGHDTEFLLDLSGLVAGGKPATVAFRNDSSIDIAGALKVDRAPLTIENPTLGVLPRAEVERLRQAALGDDAPRVAPATPDLPPDAKPGERPYEVVWSGRPEPPAQVTFDDLREWTVHVCGDAEVSLSASVEHLLWRPQLAKLRHAGGTRATTVEVRPPAPVGIPEPFDAANLWMYGDLHRDPWDKPIQVAARLEDADGNAYTIDLGPVTSGYWGLQHGVLEPAGAPPRFPLKFVALQIADCRVEGEREIYLECLHFYRQNRKPLRRYERPKAVLPVGEDGMLPTPPSGVRVSAKPLGRGAEFISESPTGTLRVAVDPERGCFDGITARWGDGSPFRPLQAGAVRPASGSDAAKSTALVSSALKGERLETTWRSEEADAAWTATYALRGRTLVLDLACPKGIAEGVSYGRIAGLQAPKAVRVPYLYLEGPVSVACGEGLFVSVLPDVYHSDFSAPNPSAGTPEPDALPVFGGTTYTALTDGTRNPLRERVLVSISPEFADVLPNIPNPVSPNRERLAPYMLVMSSSANLSLYRLMKRYGIDHVIANDFAGFFVNDYAEGFAMRWRPHPLMSVEQVQEYIRGVRELGYLWGAYADYTDFFPLNEFWDESLVSLTPESDLADAWYGNEATKATAMPGLVRAVGGKCKELYQPECVYLDVHTNRGARAIDYEAGAAGAGIGRMTVLGNGDAIAEARRQYGSTMSEGYHRWLYAGVCDMDYATMGGWQDPSSFAPLVDFDLLKVHPREHGTMMGYAPTTFLSADEPKTLNDPGCLGPTCFYRYVAASLAYGHMVMLGYGYIPPLNRTIQYYALMQGVQQEYLTDNAVEISYHNGTEFVPTSRALVEGCQERGQVRVRYSRGLVVHVNFSATENWSIAVDGRTYELPPYGWLIAKPGEILAYSALVNGHRQDYVRCPEYLYLNAGDEGGAEGAVEVAGAVWLKPGGGAWQVIPCGDLGSWEFFTPEGFPPRHRDYRLAGPPDDRGCARLVIDTQALLGKPSADVQVTGRDDAENPVEATVTRPDAAHVALTTQREVADYVLR